MDPDSEVPKLETELEVIKDPTDMDPDLTLREVEENA
jgi:hypothetical protein